MGASKGNRCSLGLGMKGCSSARGRTAGNRWQIRVVTRQAKTRDRGPPDTSANPALEQAVSGIARPGVILENPDRTEAGQKLVEAGEPVHRSFHDHLQDQVGVFLG